MAKVLFAVLATALAWSTVESDAVAGAQGPEPTNEQPDASRLTLARLAPVASTGHRLADARLVISRGLEFVQVTVAFDVRSADGETKVKQLSVFFPSVVLPSNARFGLLAQIVGGSPFAAAPGIRAMYPGIAAELFSLAVAPAEADQVITACLYNQQLECHPGTEVREVATDGAPIMSLRAKPARATKPIEPDD